MEDEVTIKNCGPIKKLTFSVPPQGGIVELRGSNGRGKTHALNALQAAVSHKGNVSPRDGTASAEVSGFGVTAHFGRRSNYSGELECEILEGKFSVEDLIDPKIADPKAADAKRVKALIQLATGEDAAKPERFYEIISKEDFDSEVSLRALNETDLVSMAAQIKRDLEAASRRDDELAAKAQLQYQTIKASATGIDLTVETDEKVLATAHETALRELGKLESEAKAAAESNRKAALAREKLEQFQKANAAPISVPVLAREFDNQNATLGKLKTEEAELEQKLRDIKKEITYQERAVKTTEALLKSATEQEELIAIWQHDIDSAETKLIPEEQLLAARKVVDDARKAMELGLYARKAKEQLEKAKESKRMASELKAKAENLREAAQATDTVLSKVVQQLGCPLRVSRGRLVTDTDRGEELFGDLSDGERVRIAMQIGIEAVKNPDHNGLLVIGQRFWQDLNPANRQLIADLVEGTGVVVVTALATDDEELTAQILDSAPALMP